jgi:8-hydroxy-5-deazaflavin:NADPH oxidoreductase
VIKTCSIDSRSYYPERDGRFPELDADETTSSGLLASLLPGAHVVTAFNTIYFGRLLKESRSDLPPRSAWRSRSPATTRTPSKR